MLTGGLVADGDGRIDVADVVVDGGVITAVERPGVAADAGTVLDITRLLIAPGFIDLHTHSDLTVLEAPEATSRISQGITTDVIGNCGFSPYPVNIARAPLHAELMRTIGQDLAGGWTDLAGFADALDAHRPAVNVVPLVGHGALRTAAVGFDDGPLTADATRVVYRLLDQALDQGAWGMSTGLTYAPSASATKDEVAALTARLARRGRVYATHGRGLEDTRYSAVEEAIAAGRTGARVQFSHLALNSPDRWGEAEPVLETFEQGRSAGVDIMFDVYPYTASSSALAQFLPAWIITGGVDAGRERLTDPREQVRAIRELAMGWRGGPVPWLWDRVVVSDVPGDTGALIGRSLADIAADDGREPAELAVELYVRHGTAVQLVLHYRAADDVAAFLRHPLALVGSDGYAQGTSGPGRPHPRSFGAHARVLARHVGPDLSWGEAIAKMTGRVADRLGLARRGRVKAGHIADLVVLDPDRICDRATFEDPRRLAVGVEHVLVNGEFALRDGILTGVRAGRVLLAGGADGG